MVGLPLNSAIDHIHNNSATAISMVTQIRRNPGIFLNAREKSLLKIQQLTDELVAVPTPR
jgi:hypothetical protein